MTHTVATLEVSERTYREIATKLRAAGYDNVFMVSLSDARESMDMSGIALAIVPPPKRPFCTCGDGGHPDYCEVHAA